MSIAHWTMDVIGPSGHAWSMTSLLTPTELSLAEVYERDGIVQVPGILGADEVEQIKSAFMQQVELDRSLGFDDGIPDGDPLARYPRFVHPHRREDTEVGHLSLRYLLDERILAVAVELIGSLLGAQSMFYFKPSGARGQAMHQDNMSLRAHPETCLAAWIAIDDVDVENGGLAVVPGTHKYELVCPEPAKIEESFTNAGIRLPDDMPPVQTVMKPGDVLFFHGGLVHGSKPNSSTDRFRRALIFHYVPETSVEVAKFYHPLVHPEDRPVQLGVSAQGGPCGEGFRRVGA